MPNGMNEDRVREIVMGLLSKELEPFRNWMLGFWSNGSKDRPPGFFQMRVKADDERYARLEMETKSQSETLKVVEQFMAAQAIRATAREKEEQDRKEQRARNLALVRWIAGIVIPALFAVLAWGYHATEPVIKILWEDYLKAHPFVTEQLKQISKDGDSTIAHEYNDSVPHYW